MKRFAFSLAAGLALASMACSGGGNSQADARAQAIAEASETTTVSSQALQGGGAIGYDATGVQTARIEVDGDNYKVYFRNVLVLTATANAYVDDNHQAVLTMTFNDETSVWRINPETREQVLVSGTGHVPDLGNIKAHLAYFAKDAPTLDEAYNELMVNCRAPKDGGLETMSFSCGWTIKATVFAVTLMDPPLGVALAASGLIHDLIFC